MASEEYDDPICPIEIQNIIIMASEMPIAKIAQATGFR
jgi:hypothetical protein